MTTAPVAYTGPTSSQAGKAVAYAYAQLGKPYVWGATGPDSFDCSGLAMYVWAKAGVQLRLCRTYFGVPEQLAAARREAPAPARLTPGLPLTLG